MNFSLFDVIVLIGVTQGFIITILIWFRAKQTKSKLLLSLLLLVFNFLCLKILLHTTGLWQTHFLRYFPLSFELAIQPLIWLYILSLTKPDFLFRKIHFVHFIPFTLSLAYSFFIYAISLGEPNLTIKDSLVNTYHFNWIKEIEDYLSVISSIIYWGMGLSVLIQYRRWVFNSTSNTDYPTYAWLRNIALLMGLLIAMLAVDVALDYFFGLGKTVFVHWQIFFVYMAALIYYIGFRGFHLAEAVLPKSTLEVPIRASSENRPMKEQPTLSDEKTQIVKKAIEEALETRQLYLDPELNIQKLSEVINVSPSITSMIINKGFGKNFRNLINDYRLAHVKRKLRDPANAHLSIAGIAYESGFNSEASFYRIFKAVEGISPKEYTQQSLSA